MSLAIVFDLDGTLIDSAPAMLGVGNTLMAEMGLKPFDLDEILRLVGRGVRPFLNDAFAARGMVADLEAVQQRFEAIYAVAPVEANRPYPGTEAALDALIEAGHRLTICTNKPAAATRHVLEGLGWAARFRGVVAGDTLPVKKPDPAPLRHAVLLAGAGPALYVGDSEVDAETAAAADVPFLLFTEGYRKGPIAAMRHHATFSRFGDLPGLAAGFAAVDTGA